MTFFEPICSSQLVVAHSLRNWYFNKSNLSCTIPMSPGDALIGRAAAKCKHSPCARKLAGTRARRQESAWSLTTHDGINVLAIVFLANIQEVFGVFGWYLTFYSNCLQVRPATSSFSGVMRAHGLHMFYFSPVCPVYNVLIGLPRFPKTACILRPQLINIQQLLK